MEELRSRSFRTNSFSARITGRSMSSRLVLDSIPAEFAAVSGYQRLSQSMRLADEPVAEYKQQRSRSRSWSWRPLGCSSTRDVVVEKTNRIQEAKGKEEDKKKKKKRSSWLPDPERRWPLQGW